MNLRNLKKVTNVTNSISTKLTGPMFPNQRDIVFYKAVVRDLRKFIIHDFNSCTGYSIGGRRSKTLKFEDCVRDYSPKFGLYT